MKNIHYQNKSKRSGHLSLIGLIAIVFSSMVGGGIFNIAQNMASSACLSSVFIAWLITGGGMVFLVLTFKILSERYPTLNQGLYQYAQEGFGNYTGFNIAWGYWLCVAAGNVAFVVMLNDAVGAFFPVLLNHGWESIIFSECMVWIMFGIVSQGIMTASFLNTLITFLKFSSIVIIIAILVVYMRVELLFSDFLGEEVSNPGTHQIGSFWSQIMGTMFITMFCFVGIEGAVMLASYAKKSKDVGKASIIGFYLALIIYAVISILCYGIRTREELAVLPDPSVAYVLRLCCGDWAYYFVICTVILSILGGYVSWTMLCSQAPYGAAKLNIFPSNFLRTNSHSVPVFGLTLSSIFMSIFIIIVCTAPDVYLAALNLTTVMVLPAYAICGGFLWKTSCNNSNLDSQETKLLKNRIIGFLCVAYCVWCIVAGGFLLFISSSILYLLGFYFYYLTYLQKRRKGNSQIQLLSYKEKILFSVIVLASIISLILIFSGKLNLS